jgi:Terminase large subunit, T4likevirus-type, N-terminal
MSAVLNYTPHPAQMEIHKARSKRFRTVCTGRRFGKTLCMAAELLDRGCGEAGGDYCWVAPTYGIADRGIDAFNKIAPGFVRIVGRMPSCALFEGVKGPCRVFFLSSDNPDSIRGFGFNGMVVDEAAYVPVDVWNYALRPTLAQTLGWAVFISTPSGRNWFYDMFTRGVTGEESFASFTFASSASPYFPQAEWEEAKRTLPADVFRQEYEAQFLEDSAGVFKGVKACTFPDIEVTLKPSGRVIIGCDLAKHTDFTVLVAMDAATGGCLAMERFNQIDWPFQQQRIKDFCIKWKGTLMLDATGVGDPVYDALARELPDVTPFKITQTTKRELVQGLMLAIEKRDVGWPASWDVLTAELERYEYEIGPTGSISYGAPSGYHDDCVIALALAQWGRNKYGAGAGMFHAFTHGWRGRDKTVTLA